MTHGYNTVNRKQRRKSGKQSASKRGIGKPAPNVKMPIAAPLNTGASSLLVRGAGIQSSLPDTQDIDFLFSMAKNHHQVGRLDQAEGIYRQILSRSASHAPSLHLLGLIMHQRGRSSDALELIASSIKKSPDDAEAQNNMGNVLRRLGRAAEAVEYFAAAIKLKPNFAGAYSNLGLTYKQLGKFSEAAAQFRQAISHDPLLAEAWGGLAKAGRLNLQDNEVEAAEKVLKNAKLSDNDQRHICFALGKHFDAVQQWEKAFRYYVRANQLGGVQQDAGATARLVKTVLDQSFPVVSDTQSVDEALTTPIFVFGMPRSGTTLVEQILASHPHVISGGELNIIDSEIRHMIPELASGDANGLTQMTPDQLITIKKAFLAECARLSDSKPQAPMFFTDKSLLNFAYLPIIRQVFPGARFVHCRRNPVDTCLSVYFTDFRAVHDYADDLDQIGQFFCLYSDLMDKWNGLMGADIFDVQYEDILDDQEAVTRHLLEYCGLPWNSACLSFFETDRQVSTPSDWQVRLPIFSTSRNRWKHYERHLEQLLQSLAPCI